MFCEIVKGLKGKKERRGNLVGNSIRTYVRLLTVTKTKCDTVGPAWRITCKKPMKWLWIKSLLKNEVIFKISVIA